MRLALILTILTSSLSAQKHPITHEDVWLMKRTGPAVVSPDGKWAVTSVVDPSYDAGKTASDLWLVTLDGTTPPRRLTFTIAPEAGPVFSPDSKRLAFSTKREGDETPQIYVLPLDGGEAMRVTNVSTGASGPQWRPCHRRGAVDCRRRAGRAGRFPQPPDQPQQPHHALDEKRLNSGRDFWPRVWEIPRP